MEFIKKNKTILAWILATVLVVSACLLWVALSGGEPTGGEETPSSSTPSSQPSSQPSSDPAGSSSQTPPPSSSQEVDDPYSVLNSAMEILNPMSTHYSNRPLGLNKSSTAEECAQYVAFRLGVLTTPYTAVSRDLASCDQELLLWYVHTYIDSVMVDDNDTYLVPAQRNNGIFVYDKAVISDILEDIFGVSGYVINCSGYDPGAGTYTVTDYGRGGMPPLQYVGDVQWNGNDAFTCSIYFYERTNTKVLQIEDWELKIDLKLERMEAGGDDFFVSSMITNEK